MNDNKIEYLKFPESIRARIGIYLGSNQRDGLNTALRELTDNSCDEVGSGHGNVVHVSNNLGGYCYVADDSDRGMPIRMSTDIADRTEAYLSISEIHTSGKFQAGDIGRVGLNGVGSSAVNATSSIYALLVRITDENYKGSIPEVEKAWKEVGPRQKNELYYIVICEKGYKKFESCLLLKDIEKMLYGKSAKNIIPRGMTTIVLFKPDPEIFECDNLIPDVPYTNLNYFLLIQQRFFGRKKVRVIIDGEDLKCSFKPFKYEIATTIKPKDPDSPNKEVGIYLTMEADPELGKVDKDMFASVNGLDCKTGFHVNLARTAFKSAIRSQYKITHEYVLEGLRFGIIVLANECVFSSQTKENLKAITKVKIDDFTPLVKEIEKIFKKDSEYWNLHFEKVNQFWDAHRSIGAADKAQKMIDATSGVSSYRAKADFPKTFADATSKDRSQCELFLVEGNSAQSSLVMGRKDTRYHACLGLRGKILNVTDKSVDRALESKVINDIFNIIGLGLDVNWVGKDAKTYEEAHEIIMRRSRFSKVIIATDAD